MGCTLRSWRSLGIKRAKLFVCQFQSLVIRKCCRFQLPPFVLENAKRLFWLQLSCIPRSICVPFCWEDLHACLYVSLMNCYIIIQNCMRFVFFFGITISPILVHELDDTMVDFSLSQMLIAYCSIGSGNFCIHFRYLSCWMHFPVRD